MSTRRRIASLFRELADAALADPRGGLLKRPRVTAYPLPPKGPIDAGRWPHRSVVGVIAYPTDTWAFALHSGLRRGYYVFELTCGHVVARWGRRPGDGARCEQCHAGAT